LGSSKSNRTDLIKKNRIFFIIFFTISLSFSSFVTQNTTAEKIFYPTLDYQLQDNPTVCAFKPSIEDMARYTQEGLMKETKYSISEWEVKLQQTDFKHKDKWDITYIEKNLEDDHSECDVEITFLAKPEDPNMYYNVLGITWNDPEKEKTFMQIFYQEVVTCKRYEGNYVIFYPCYTENVSRLDLLGVITRHEFGHVLGLGHYAADDPELNAAWSKGATTAPSIMVMFSYEFPGDMQIRPVDIEKIRQIYDDDGFSGNQKDVIDVNPIQEEINQKEMQIQIPSWVKTNAGWWSQKQISDDEFVKAIEFLIKENIIQIPESMKNIQSEEKIIPEWIKMNAAWWSQDAISDSDFVKGLEFLIQQGIINI